MMEDQKPTTDEERIAMAEASAADHDYFVIQSITDVDKMRDEAWRLQQGHNLTRTSESAMIHHHRLTDKCLWRDEIAQEEEDRTQKHEHWPRIKLEK
jgi:hypothetical protein